MKETVILERGDWTAEIAPAVGGNIVGLWYRGQSVLRHLDVHSPLPERITRYGATILFPVNCTEKGRFSFQGKSYQLPVDQMWNGNNMHGSVYLQAFRLLQRDQTSVALCFENLNEVYPFPFRLVVTYRLENEGVTAIYQITNTGDGDMPYTFGLHTTFPEPDLFHVDIAQVQETDESGCVTGRYLPLSEEEQMIAAGKGVSKGHPLLGFYRASGNTASLDGKIIYELVKGFDHWTVFNGGGKSGILCLEPQCGAVNGLNIPEGHKVLKKGTSVELEWRLYLRK